MSIPAASETSATALTWGRKRAYWHTAVYSVYCYEVAQDRQERDFPWDEAGVEELKQWLQAKYDQFSAGKGLAD